MALCVIISKNCEFERRDNFVYNVKSHNSHAAFVGINVMPHYPSSGVIRVLKGD